MKGHEYIETQEERDIANMVNHMIVDKIKSEMLISGFIVIDGKLEPVEVAHTTE